MYPLWLEVIRFQILNWNLEFSVDLNIIGNSFEVWIQFDPDLAILWLLPMLKLFDEVPVLELKQPFSFQIGLLEQPKS